MLPKSGDKWTLHEAAHLLSRAGFGGSPEEIRGFHELGRYKAVESLLSPAEANDAFPPPEWMSDEKVLASIREHFQRRRELKKNSARLSPEEADRARRELVKEIQRESRRHALEGQGWWFRRMLKTQAPLREKMTLFWHDHFATSVQKVRDVVLLMKQNELFREHAFGSFKQLTQAILLDPAMTLYLDNNNSKRSSPNENFAREVMELFTLGEGNYTENDIREAARAFTGYQLNRLRRKVEHQPQEWDDGDKTIFGKTGRYKGSDVVDLIFEQPAVAKFLTRKIWAFFVCEPLPDRACEMLAEVFRKADFQVGPLLREIFLSKEFYSESLVRSQIKCPVQYLVQLLKQLEVSEPPTGFAISSQLQLGQVLFMPPNVAGWDWGQAWINTNTLLSRYHVAGFLTKGSETGAGQGSADQKPGMVVFQKRASRAWAGPDYEKIAPRSLRENPAELVDSLVFRFFQGAVPAKARDSFVDYAKAKKGVVFTDKETAELCHLILSTPYYQLC